MLPSRFPPGPSTSAMSTTSGFAAVCASAFSTIGANSVSVTSTFASACFSMKAIVSASSRVLSVLSTPPVIGTPKCNSTISGVLAAMTATVSPLPIPAFASADARRRLRAYVSAHV